MVEEKMKSLAEKMCI